MIRYFPGVILYRTGWFPAAYRAKIVGIFMAAIPVAGLIGSPVSGAIVGMGGWIKEATDRFPPAMMPFALVAAVGAVCLLVSGRLQPRTMALQAAHS